MRPLWDGLGLRLSGWGHYFPHLREEQPPESLPPLTRGEAAVLGDELGVLSRHVADETETVAVMATRAARDALARAGKDPGEVDLLILASWTEPGYVPETAPAVAAALGADRALAFNVNAACAGFVHGVHMAASMIVAQGLRCAVVVAADHFTRRLHPRGWGSKVAGDGAGAAVIEAGPPDVPGLRDSIMLSFPEHADTAVVSPVNGWGRSKPKIAGVAAETAAIAVERILDRNQVKLSDVDYVVTHPGSLKILNTVQERLGAEPGKVLTNFGHRGSTSGATVPSAVSEYLADGRLRRGELLITPVMGAGWYSGALLFTL